MLSVPDDERKKKEQDVSGSAEAAENSNSAIRPADAFDRHTRARTRTRDVICSREATVFWSSRMIDRFHRYTSSSVSLILFQHFALSTPRRNSISFLQLSARASLNSRVLIRSTILSRDINA